MRDPHYARLWLELESILTRALELERDRIGAEDAHNVAEFINHNEFGLAHDQLVNTLSETSLTPREETGILLTQAAQLMGGRTS